MEEKRTKSFAGQLKKAFIIVVLLPVCCIGGFWFYSVYRHMERQSTSESRNAIEQNYVDLINRIDACENSITYLAANYTLHQFLMLDETSYLDIGRSSKEIGVLLYHILMTNQHFKSITIYTEKNYQVLTDFFQDAKEVQETFWYQGILNSGGVFWWSENDKLYLGCPIMSAYPNQAVGVAKIEIEPGIFQESFHIFQRMPVHIEMEKDKMSFYQYTHPDYQGNPKLHMTKKIESENWMISYWVDKSYYTNHVFMSFLPVVSIILIVMVLSWLIIHHFFQKLAGGLQTLVNYVEEAQRGNLDVDIQSSETTELNILAQSIRSFLRRIQQLIQQVYVKEIERQELELNLLQSKMSPHFLYNNLSAINWLALECGQDKIYEITTELATFYRTALNKGKNVGKLRVEIENIKAYLHLQLIAHEYSFEISYDVKEELLDCEVPIFVLQPLVENAIAHGIHQLRGRKGQIKISVQLRGDCMEMEVFDNGTALYEKIGAAILPEEAFGYGTSNVHKRISLLYGKNSGLTICAEESGTHAKILFFPKQYHISQL